MAERLTPSSVASSEALASSFSAIRKKSSIAARLMPASSGLGALHASWGSSPLATCSAVRVNRPKRASVFQADGLGFRINRARAISRLRGPNTRTYSCAIDSRRWHLRSKDPRASMTACIGLQSGCGFDSRRPTTWDPFLEPCSFPPRSRQHIVRTRGRPFRQVEGWALRVKCERVYLTGSPQHGGKGATRHEPRRNDHRVLPQRSFR